jgi:hypothetical protein
MATRRRRSPAPTRRAAALIMISRKRGAKPTPLDARTLRTIEAVAQPAREGALAVALAATAGGSHRSSARGFPLWAREESPRRFRCQGEGYNGALTHPKSRASSPAVDYPQVAAELIDAAAKAAATETSTEVAAEALDILRPGSGLGPVALHQTQAHAPTGEAEGRGKGEGGGQGRGVAPAEEAGGEEQELHGGDEGENEGEEDEDDDDIELEEHELAKALPRAGRGKDGWPIAGLTHLPHRPVLAVAEIVEAGGWLTTQRTPTESPRSARPAHRAIQPAQL